jgi:hypothetical protein
MSYILNHFNNSQSTITVEDGRINDDTTHIKFVGRNFAGYGEFQNENFLWLLENFSSGDEPTKKTTGMIWFDSANKKLKFYDGSKFRTTGGAEVGATKPKLTGLIQTQGDFWYKTSTVGAGGQVYVYDPDYTANDGYVLIGPQAVAGKGTTNFESIKVTGTQGTVSGEFAIIQAIIDGDVIFIVSTDSFTLTSPTIAGFTHIHEGITLVNSTSGVTTTGFANRFWGTASDAEKLGGLPSTDYLLKATPVFTAQADFPNAGIRIGDSPNYDIKIFVDTTGGRKGIIKNQISNTLFFKTTNSGTELTPLVLSNRDVTGGATSADNLSYNLGTASIRWNQLYVGEIWATTIHGAVDGSIEGTASQSDRLKINDSATDASWASSHYRSAMTTATAYTIAARNSSGDIFANVFRGEATAARYADLAERYEADAEYEPGTVLVFGGEKEITTTDSYADTRVAGVVSTAPAYLMNEAAGTDLTHPPIALRGKIPVKVIGIVKKGDVLVTSGRILGYAEVPVDQRAIPAAAIVGKSLENKDDEGTGIIVVVV